ncbi:hypothetical protein KY358_05175 [Candidatus Woesearchaeota archaeon]|nr:hypothetical protein [Candidatus Woesearchaeota archaeon]
MAERKKVSVKGKRKSKAAKEMKIDLSALKFCPECASTNIFYSKTRDELICRDCAAIFSKLSPDQMRKYKASLK